MGTDETGRTGDEESLHDNWLDGLNRLENRALIATAVSFSFRSDKVADDFDHVVDHFRGEAGVGAEEHGLVHDAVGAWER